MKKSFYPYIKIKRTTDFSVFGIILAALLSFIVTIFTVCYLPDKVWLWFIVFIFGFLTISFLNFFICKAILKKEAKKHKKYIKLTIAEKSLTELFEKNQPIKVKDNLFVYAFQEKMLNTISVYYLNEQTTFKDLKPLRKEVNKFLKDNYAAARESRVYKRHHELNMQLYVTNKFNDNILTHLTDGGEQMNDIGFFRCYWCVETQSVWIPFYKGKFMDYNSAKNYHNAYKKLIQLFVCNDYSEENFA